MLNFKIFGIIFLQYSSFKYYTFCNEKNDSLVLGGPSMNLGPEIRRKTVEVDTCGKDLTTCLLYTSDAADEDISV